MPHNQSHTKVGVYVDVENIKLSGGRYMKYKVLREFACRDGSEALRLNAYAAYDKNEEGRTNSFFSELRDYGYKVIRKEAKFFKDGSGKTIVKANSDLDLAVDALLQSENLDRVVLATGDGDFVQVVRALQNKGCRVEVVAFENVSVELRREADLFLCGYLIPGLVPTSNPLLTWGEENSRVRGTCYYFHQSNKTGLLRVLKNIDPYLWVTDVKDSNSPYAKVSFRERDLPENVNPYDLPTRNIIFEFTLVTRGEGEERKYLAEDIQVKYEFPFID